MPQPPQLDASPVRSAQKVPVGPVQRKKPGQASGTQAPRTQDAEVPQTRPQPPQLLPSDETSMQRPPQLAWPSAQGAVHTPPPQE